MSRRTRWHNGREFTDPRGYTYEPRSWWEEDRARKATRVALVFWALLLVGLILVIHQARTG